MPRLPIFYAVTAATYAGLTANDFPDGQVVIVTDDDNKMYEARGADGARAWVQVTVGGAVAAGDIDATGITDGFVLTADGAGAVAWEDGGGGGTGEQEVVNTDDEGVFKVTIGTAWQIDGDGLCRYITDASYTTGTAKFAVDADGLPYLEAL